MQAASATAGNSWTCGSCRWYMHVVQSGRLTLNGRKVNSCLPSTTDTQTTGERKASAHTAIEVKESTLALLRTVVHEGDEICTVETNVHEPPVPATSSSVAIADSTSSSSAAAGCDNCPAHSTHVGSEHGALLTLLQPDPHYLNTAASSTEVVLLSAQLLAVDKPCGVPVHPSGGYQRNSLLHILEVEHEEYDLRPLHRLDRMTSGVVSDGHSKVNRLRPRFSQSICCVASFQWLLELPTGTCVAHYLKSLCLDRLMHAGGFRAGCRNSTASERSDSITNDSEAVCRPRVRAYAGAGRGGRRTTEP